MIGNWNCRHFAGWGALILSLCLGFMSAAAQAQVYGLKTAQAGNGTSANRNTVLFTVTPTVAPPLPANTVYNATVVAPVTLGGVGVLADGLAIDSNDALFAYVNENNSYTPTNGGSQLVRLDKATGVATAVGAPLPDSSVGGAAFDMNDRLWVFEWIGHRLLQIDPADGSIVSSVPVTGITLANAYWVDIAFDIDNNAWFSTNVAAATLYSLDTATGVVTPFYTFPNSLVSNGSAPGVLGMAFYRNEEAWFAQGSSIDRVVYAPAMDALAGAWNAVVNLTTDTGIANSGPMDLAARPNRVTAQDNQATTPVDTPVTIAILNNDQDFWNPPGVNISVDGGNTRTNNTWSQTTANGGTAALNLDGTVTYTPASGFIGTDTFTYRVLADDGSWDEATVTVIIRAQTPDTPVPTLNPFALMLLVLTLMGLAAGMRRKR
jgi:hypothetical protein